MFVPLVFDELVGCEVVGLRSGPCVWPVLVDLSNEAFLLGVVGPRFPRI